MRISLFQNTSSYITCLPHQDYFSLTCCPKHFSYGWPPVFEEVVHSNKADRLSPSHAETNISLFIFIYIIDSHTCFINKDKCSPCLKKSKSCFQKQLLSTNWWETQRLEHQWFNKKRIRNAIKWESWPC